MHSVCIVQDFKSSIIVLSLNSSINKVYVFFYIKKKLLEPKERRAIFLFLFRKAKNGLLAKKKNHGRPKAIRIEK